MTSPALLAALPALALAGGAALAQLSGPQACTWPAGGAAMLRRLNAVKSYRRPGRIRTVAGAVLLAGLLTGGGLAAYAAAPAVVSAPDRLPADIQGVVGSGDQLSLKLKDSAGGRTLRPGEVYADGWTLKGVTPSTATLIRNGDERVVGLNPEGRAPSPAAPVAPSSVTLVGIPDKATIDRYVALGFVRFGPTFMTPTDDPDRLRGAAYQMMIQEDVDRRLAANRAAGGDGLVGSTRESDRAVLGEAAYADYLGLAATRVGELQAQIDPDLAARPITGPSSYYLSPGSSVAAAQAAAGVDPRGVWRYGPPDAQGGRTATRLADGSPSLAAAQAAAR